MGDRRDWEAIGPIRGNQTCLIDAAAEANLAGLGSGANCFLDSVCEITKHVGRLKSKSDPRPNCGSEDVRRGGGFHQASIINYQLDSAVGVEAVDLAAIMARSYDAQNDGLAMGVPLKWLIC